jgi:hypothetical protein
LNAKNSSDSYTLTLNKSYSKDNYSQKYLTTFSPPVFIFPTFTPINVNEKYFLNNNYLVSISNDNLFIEPEIFVSDYLLIKRNKKIFSKIDLPYPVQDISEQNTANLTKGQTAFPEYSYRISQFRKPFNEDNFGEYFKAGCKIWGGIGLGMMATLMAVPRTVTKWEGDYIQDAISNLGRAYTQPPVWDQDHWQLNYVGHPYAGGLYYNTIRAQGGNPFQSLLFSTCISSAWEYLLEATAEQPSIQDLFVTPLVGSAIGELSHQATLKMQKNGYTIVEKVVVTIINPMYVLLNGYH